MKFSYVFQISLVLSKSMKVANILMLLLSVLQSQNLVLLLIHLLIKKKLLSNLLVITSKALKECAGATIRVCFFH